MGRPKNGPKVEMIRKPVMMTPQYQEKLNQIKERLGLVSDSEVIRRAIDHYCEKLGIELGRDAGKSK